MRSILHWLPYIAISLAMHLVAGTAVVILYGTLAAPLHRPAQAAAAPITIEVPVTVEVQLAQQTHLPEVTLTAAPVTPVTLTASPSTILSQDAASTTRGSESAPHAILRTQESIQSQRQAAAERQQSEAVDISIPHRR